MNRAEWDAMDGYDKDNLVWHHFPCIAPDSEDWVLSTDGGETGFNLFDTEEEANDALPRYANGEYADATVVHWRHVRHFTADRNACALVLDEVDLPVLLTHLLAVTGETDIDLGGRAGTQAMCNLLRADPDLICYCALKAVEDARQ